jgi:hypothetical protein
MKIPPNRIRVSGARRRYRDHRKRTTEQDRRWVALQRYSSAGNSRTSLFPGARFLRYGRGMVGARLYRLSHQLVAGIWDLEVG